MKAETKEEPEPHIPSSKRRKSAAPLLFTSSSAGSQNDVSENKVIVSCKEVKTEEGNGENNSEFLFPQLQSDKRPHSSLGFSSPLKETESTNHSYSPAF